MTPAPTLAFPRSQRRLLGSVIDSSTSLLAEQTHDIVRFAMGAPSEDLMPIAALDDAFASQRSGRFDYGESAGEPRLREQILRLVGETEVATTDDRLLVTTGGMQGLDLAFKLCVDSGDLVIVEAPTYTNGNATALSYGTEVIGAPTDAHGLIVDSLPEIVARAGRTPKAIYTIPNFQNPMGVTLTRERRVRLLELAERWGAMIIEDDPYGLLRFGGEHVASFAEIAPGHPLVFQVRTFSKTIAPGLRVGWIDVDPALRQLAISAKQAMDTCTGVPAQNAVATFLENGHLAPHIERLKPIYRERKIAMRRELERAFGDRAVATDPDGGFFLWVTFAGALESIDTEALFADALAEGVAYIPGPAFTTDGSMRNSLRLCFATSSPKRIAEGVDRLARAAARAVPGAGLQTVGGSA